MVLSLLALTVMVVAPAFAAADPGKAKVNGREYDPKGRLVWEFGEESDGLPFARHHFHADAVDSSALTDCSATAYRRAGWSWASPYEARASSYAAELDAAASTWDNATSADIFGAVIPGSSNQAGVRDNVNQMDWVSLGATSTIAVTTTWYNRFSKVAVESDARYNLYYAWNVTGAAGAMDVVNIATHELGHTFGLDHPKGPAAKIGCLTMYAYGSLGETQKRSLGDGDVLGIQAIYGT